MTTRATMLIGGQWRDTPRLRDIRSPAGQGLVEQVAVGGRGDATAAADAAASAFGDWADTPPRRRADLLRRAADLISERAGQIGGLLAAEAGKRRPEADGEVAFAAARVWRMADNLQVGILGVNDPLPSVCFAPMDGVKQSGIGREGAAIGLEEFEDIRYVAVGQ